MKGLLIKDSRLLLQQKSFLVVVIGLACAFTILNLDSFFAVGYCTFMLAFVAVGTISYDDTGNGLAYILTWPVSRKQYVMEKYLFCGIAGSVTWLVVTVLAGAFQAVKTPDFSMTDFMVPSLVILFIVLLSMGVMLPIQLKFGTERGRIVTFLMLIGLVGGIGFVEQLAPQINLAVLAIDIDKISPFVVGIFAVLLLIITVTVSMRISMGIIRKKEL